MYARGGGSPDTASGGDTAPRHVPWRPVQRARYGGGRDGRGLHERRSNGQTGHRSTPPPWPLLPDGSTVTRVDVACLELAAEKWSHDRSYGRIPDPRPDLDATPDMLIAAVYGEPDSLEHPWYRAAKLVVDRVRAVTEEALSVPLVSEKVCCACEQLLPASAFGTNRTARDGLQVWCFECSRERRAESARRRAEEDAA